jgi:uncharacterized membrane protein YphA (DoxX/SURF4 family)
MDTSVAASQTSPKWQIWTGRVISALPVLALLTSGAMKLSHAPPIIENMVTKGGFPEASVTPIGIVEILCALLFAVPLTRFLGAVLITGYLGGAIATHVRGGEGFAPALILGVLPWLGLYLRDEKARALSPLRA